MCRKDFTLVIVFISSVFIVTLESTLSSAFEGPFSPNELHCVTPFHSQVDYILQRARLKKEAVQRIEELVRDVENALQEDWPGTKIIPYGSIISGIGLHSSDIDLYVSLPSWARNDTPPYELVSKAKEILRRFKYQNLFENVTAKHIYKSKDEVPIIKMYHKILKQGCDISFNTIAVFDNKLISYLIHTASRVFKIMFLIKFWGKMLSFPSHVSCILRILVIFYFQQLDMLPPIYLLQKTSFKNDSVNNWDTSFEEPFYLYYTAQNVSLYHLLGGFFQYYSGFDFKNHIVSAFAGYPIKRNMFEDINDVPDIFVSYKTIISNKEQYPLNISSEFCVPQLFVHNFNSGNKIDKNMANVMVKNFRLAAKMYKESREEDFLSVLFNKYLFHCLNEQNELNEQITIFSGIWITNKKKNSTPMWQSKTAFREFIDCRPHGFFSKGINELPMRWQKCIDNNGAYFD